MKQKNKNGITNHTAQKYVKQARKELKKEGLITDNSLINLAKIISRACINFAAETCAKELIKEYTKTHKKFDK